MNKIGAILVFSFLVILLICLPFIKKANQHTVDIKLIDSTKTYEQGLWDGFNGAFKYLDYTHQIKDTLRIEITIADSILHAKK